MHTDRPHHGTRGFVRGVSLFAALLALAVGIAGCEDRVSTAGPGDPPAEAVLLRDVAAADLLTALDERYSPDRTLGYGRARDELYGWEQSTVGALCGMYTDYCVTLQAGDPSAEASRLGINAEHVWPQSMGAREEPLRSDLHHVFPAREQVNSSRGNLPFGEVPDGQADAWYRGSDSQSSTPEAGIDGWSERGAGRFEPREDRKGDVARAVFYVVAMYPEQIEPSFFRTMQTALLAWNRADPPDERERQRSAWIASLQGTENPFVVDFTLADRIWNGGVASDETPAPAPTPAETGATGPLWINEIHYDNEGDDTGEGVEIAGPDGTELEGWSLVLVNGSTGEAYRTIPLAGVLVGDGLGMEWVPVAGLQNGSPDGAALVDPSGHVAEAIAWEGTMSALGVRFTDIGVQQTSDTPVSTSLQRVGAGRTGADFQWASGDATPGWLNEGQRWQ